MAITTSLSLRSPHASSHRASASLARVFVASLFAVGVSVGTPAAQSTDGTWSSPFDHPASRRYHNVVYDPLHARMIVFGGTSGTFEEIWTLSLGDRSEWSSHRVSGAVPRHRIGASAMFDPLRDRVIMYEGDELWSLSISGVPTWTPLQAVGPAPPSRSWHSAVYDSKRDRMIVFGGNHGETLLGDVWALDLAGGPTWEHLDVSMPDIVPRRMHAATYDPVHDRMLVAGGERWGTGYPSGSWELRLSGAVAWREISSTAPPGRVGASLFYDPDSDRAVLLGGWGTVRNGNAVAWTDVWTLPAATQQWGMVLDLIWLWLDQAPAIYDTAHRRVVAYRGTDAMMIPTLDMGGPELHFSWIVPKPWPRYGQTATYDPKRERMIMTLGWNQDGPDDQTWELPLNGKPMWSVLPTSGAALEQFYPTATNDPIGDRMIVFGGYASNETWELPLANPAWNRLSPGGTVPEFREGHSAIYDPRRHRMIVFGGVGYTGSRTDAFALALDGTLAWSPLPPGPPRAWHNAVYDPVGDRMLVFGGAADRWYSWTNEVWSLSLAEPMVWSQLAPAGEAPSARSQASAIYDPIRNRLVLHGGCCSEDEDGYTQAFGDTWELALDGPPRWRRMTSTGSPPRVRAANLVYDPPRDRAILYGGLDGDEDFPRHDEATALTWGNPVLPAVSIPGDIVAGTPLILEYVVSNPLPWPRAIEWTLSSERDWPGFPSRGVEVVAGGSSQAVRIERTLPEGSIETPNELTFAAGFSGAPGHVAVLRHLVLSQPVATKLAIRVLGPAAGAGPRVEFTLRDASPARLELLDVAGRRLLARPVGSLGPGTHALDLSEGGALKSGIYFARLLQAGDEVHARAAVIR